MINMSLETTLQEALQSNKVSASAHANILLWLTQPKYEEYLPALTELIEQAKWQELNDSFFQVVPFGTGGRRGTVGLGPNRINRVTIGESAQGLADYLLSLSPTAKEAGVVIAHDTRLTSEEFTAVTASVLAGNGFKVYVFDGFRATPELSFAVRHLKAAAGVVISASHNPPQDNGFKVYWSDGGQLVSPHAEKLTEFVSQVKEIRKSPETEARMPRRREPLEAHEVSITARDDGDVLAKVDKEYLKAILAESLVSTRSAQVVYSPLHGTGIRSALPALTKAGFSVTLVDEQATPDGAFPTVAKNSPNPENVPANDQARELAQKLEADFAITTDPDADRLGVITKTESGEYLFLTGNQIAALLGWFVADQMKEQKRLTPQHFFVKTIVTTDFLNAIASDFGIRIYDDLLIGFKYVAEMIRNYQDNGDQVFLFGGEESHGILKGSYTRDKDAAIAALLMAELASYLKDQGHTIAWQLDQLYRRYGIFTETLSSTYYEGATGFAKMQAIMTTLRATPPAKLGQWDIVSMIDRVTGQHGTPGDVLIFHLSADKHTRLTIRPSGTEPKLKIYTQLHTPVAADISDVELASAKQAANEKADQLTKAITEYLNS